MYILKLIDISRKYVSSRCFDAMALNLQSRLIQSGSRGEVSRCSGFYSSALGATVFVAPAFPTAKHYNCLITEDIQSQERLVWSRLRLNK